MGGIRQGSRTYIAALAARLPAAAPDLDFVFYVTPAGRDEAARLAGDAPNVAIRDIPAGRFARLVFPFPWRLGREVDVFHCQYIAPLVPTVPCVITLHDILHETMPQYFPRGLSRLMRLLYPLSARRAAMVLTVSDYCRGEIVRRYGVAPERVAFVHSGLDAAFSPVADAAALAGMRRRLGIPEGRYILSLGRIEPRKNLPGLVAAYRLVRERLGAAAPLLVIAGPDDGLFADFGRQVRDSGGGEGIVFCGGVAQADLPALYSDAAVFAYPSFGEGFGLPVLEAMGCGAPVVAGSAPAVPEVAGDAALFVDRPTRPVWPRRLCGCSATRSWRRICGAVGLSGQRGLTGTARWPWPLPPTAGLRPGNRGHDARPSLLRRSRLRRDSGQCRAAGRRAGRGRPGDGPGRLGRHHRGRAGRGLCPHRLRHHAHLCQNRPQPQ
ncbi:Glycosyltransferase [Desulfovibrio sp. DV]|uniref:glycosyltransferase family 4 protein n=1 Tax=Desulfovibrio sp. DV TaxID=1844708 RepID=UPI000959B51F|nr:glycosyltransferase family 1 protein [Desulfovibrio sp. DV]OLN27989.1 Glycosyltransferase [Desulfovibrio sp. DV]